MVILAKTNSNKLKQTGTLPIFKKNVALCIVLSIVTVGIYLVYWQYKLVKNYRALRGDKSSCVGEFLLFTFVPFYHYYWFFTRGTAVKNMLKAMSYRTCGDGYIYLIFDVCRLGIVSMAIMQIDFNSMPVDKMPAYDGVKGFVHNSSVALLPCNDEINGSPCYRVDKLFFSPVKEEEWLNSMAASGYVLVGRKFSGYIFAVDGCAENYYYSLCSLSTSAESESSQAVIEKRVAMGSELVYTYGNKAYFKTPVEALGECDGIAFDSASKHRHLRGVFAFNAGLMCFWLGLLCYNLVYWVRFDSAGVTVTEKTSLLWKFTIDMSSVFGDYPTTPYISLFLVLTVLCIPFTVYFFDQYLYARRLSRLSGEILLSKIVPARIYFKGNKKTGKASSAEKSKR